MGLKRPDGSVSLLVINKDPGNQRRLSLKGVERTFGTLLSYSSREYRRKPDGMNGHPVQNLPHSIRMICPDQPLVIPPWSIAVLK